MKNVDWYMDEARRVSNLASDRKLSLALGIAQTSPNYWRARKTWPSEENMVALAKLAGVDPAQALLDLAQWRAKDANTAAIWKRLASLVATLALPLFVLVTSADQAHASVTAEVSAAAGVYYGKLRRWLRALKKVAGVPFQPALAWTAPRPGSGLSLQSVAHA